MLPVSTGIGGVMAQAGQQGGGWSRRKRLTVWISGGVVGFLVLMFIIGTIVGPPKTKDDAAPAGATATSSSPSPTVTTPSPTPTTTPPTTPATTPPTTATTPPPTTAAAAKPKPKAKPSAKSCEPTRDVLVWMKVPGMPDSAQTLGNYYVATCESTFSWLQRSSPTDPGYCTEAAWASDNPGYNVDAEPARHLRKVQMMVGPAC